MIFFPFGSSRELHARLSRPPTPASRREGAATVEMALIAPMLIFLLLGTFEMSRGFMVKEILHDAVRKACRTGILPNQDNAAITKEVNDVLTDNNISTTGVTITVLVNGSAGDAGTAVRNDQISVKVAVPVSQVYWLTAIFLQATMIESETVVMMKQE